MWEKILQWFSPRISRRIEEEKRREKDTVRQSITLAEAEKKRLKKITIYIEESTTKDIARALGVLK